MPHIILEHSDNIKNIDYSLLFAAIEATLPDMGTCKMRAMPQSIYYIGDVNQENAFVFLRVLMSPQAQRDDAFRDAIGKSLLPIIDKYITPVLKSLNLTCFPTLEVGLLSKQYYWLED